MKCKVRLTQTVEMYVEGQSWNSVQEWLLCTTPQEAIDCAENEVSVYYDEEIVCEVRDDSEVDYVIEEMQQ